MPLVRYRTGDLIRLPKGLNKKGIEDVTYGIKPFMSIEGRSADYLVSPDGTRLVSMNQVPRDINGIIQMQFVQESLNTVRILVVPAKSFTDADKEQIIQNAYSKLPRTMKVNVELVDTLDRTTQGKVPFIVRNPKLEINADSNNFSKIIS